MNVLVIAPHPDDEVLGCGGTMLKRACQGHKVSVCIVTKGYTPPFNQKVIEQGRQEALKAHHILKVHETFFLNIPSLGFSEIPVYELNKKFTDLFEQVKPDEIYIPHRGDIHIDHKLTADAAMVAARPKNGCTVKRIYGYEVLSETGWDLPTEGNSFIPTVYEDISPFLSFKRGALNAYKSQLCEYPDPRSLDAISALAMYRGSTVGTAYAEAFSLLREIKGV